MTNKMDVLDTTFNKILISNIPLKCAPILTENIKLLIIIMVHQRR